MEAAVTFRDVSFSYAGHPALRSVSFAIPRGALYGLIGPNGAGKSTTLGLVTTLLRPAAGSVAVGGHDTVRATDAVRRLLGYAPEEPVVYSGLTARELAVLSATLHGMDEAAGRAATGVLLERFGLGARGDDVIAAYSKGMRRKALLVAALVHDPDVLVLDEPLDGLDVVAQAALKELLVERTRAGKTVVYSTHILEVVDSLCTHVGVLRAGQLLASGTLAEARATLGVADLAGVFRAPAEEAA